MGILLQNLGLSFAAKSSKITTFLKSNRKNELI